MRNTDHVVVSASKRRAGDSLFECRHCNGTLEVASPVRLDDWLAASRSFIGTHGACVKPEGTPEGDA